VRISVDRSSENNNSKIVSLAFFARAGGTESCEKVIFAAMALELSWHFADFHRVAAKAKKEHSAIPAVGKKMAEANRVLNTAS